MTTARERMKQLSGLSGAHSARAHFLAVTQGTGTGVDRFVFASQMTVCVEEPRVTLTRSTVNDCTVFSAQNTQTASQTAIRSEVEQDDTEHLFVTLESPRIDRFMAPECWWLLDRPQRITYVQSLPNEVITRL